MGSNESPGTDGIYITLFQRYTFPFSDEFAAKHIRPAGNGWFHIDQAGCDEIAAAAQHAVEIFQPLLTWLRHLNRRSTLPAGHGARYHGSRTRRFA